jgi:predicted cupin superfamily sugar epimerase
VTRDPGSLLSGSPDLPVDGEGRASEEPSAAEMIAALDLKPHREGGYFRETYRAVTEVPVAEGKRPACSAIIYLLTEAEPSRFHRLRSDELWFYHSGALAELVLLPPPAEGAAAQSQPFERLPEHRLIGPVSPYVLVPAGWWVAVRTSSGEQTDWGDGRAPERRWTADRRSTHDISWTLVSCVVTPGFEYKDFEMADREVLLREFPLAREVILALT